MNFSILGSGNVGSTIAAALRENGHTVHIGTRSAKEGTVSYNDAASQGDILFNCTSGSGSIEALSSIATENLNGKILIDISNPLDFSKGFPPRLFVCNDDSLGETIQRTFPSLKVVKTLNTVTCDVMVKPSLLPAEQDMLMCSNDNDAKATVAELLKNEFGWTSIVDIGDLTGARSMEMFVLLWVRLYSTFGSAIFGTKFVR